MSSEPRVILRHCPTYDVARIESIAREAIAELGLRPAGRVLVKPNLVAAGRLFQHAHTRPEVVEGVLRALRATGGDAIDELAVGERCGITIPTRAAFAQSGFNRMLRRVRGVKRYLFEEEPQVEIPLTHAGRLRDYLYTPEPVARADFFVNVPKFKAHPWTTVTFSMKNYIGIQDDRHRLIDHDHRLNEKVADLQYVLQPQLIVIDAVIGGEGRMLTPRPFEMGLLVLGNNQVAFDAVCCAIIGIDPRSIEHIRLAEERGFGTTDLSAIRLSGDVSLDEARRRGAGFEVGLVRVEKYFEGTKITAYAGPPPEVEHTDYCWGGCPGAIEEAIEILRMFDKACDEKMPRMHVVFGAYRGPIDAKPGEKVVFIGDCAEWQGQLDGELVQIGSTYVPREERDPRHARHDDIYAKILGVRRTLSRARKQPYVRLRGCPVSVAEQILTLVELGGTRNPYFDVREVLGFNRAYLGWRIASAFRRLFGQPYQKAGPCTRGQAAPPP
jgi:uncharacterized protein (DUF362 family)